MKHLIKILILFFICEVIVGPPVRKTPEPKDIYNKLNSIVINKFNASTDLHYKTYLEEIIKELESDKKFAEAIKSAEDHNRTDHIAQSLSFVNHHIRNKLDEIKRKEIDRLNLLEQELDRQKAEAQGKKVPLPNSNVQKIISADKNHLDHKNPHSFEISDLKKLIEKTEEDLKWVDNKEEDLYKEHEMKKEYLKKKKLEGIKDVKQREEEAKKFAESEKRHDVHGKVHHPGNEEQLKEVWEKGDKLDPKEFNVKAFFDMHDINADGRLDINEIEALMQNELSKVYEANNTDDDMQERYHEMIRMRHEMLKSMDKDGDNLISRDEFFQYSSSPNFKDDSTWKTQEETDQKPYTDEELNDFAAGYDGQADDEDDEFSDQDETLRHIPRHEAPKVSPSEHTAIDPSLSHAEKEAPTPHLNDPEVKVNNPPANPPKL